MRSPDTPTTPEQFKVIFWATIIIFVGLGAIGMYFSWGAAPDKAELALKLRNYSLASWAIAAIVFVLRLGFDYLSD